jgi:hypothetical protein
MQYPILEVFLCCSVLLRTIRSLYLETTPMSSSIYAEKIHLPYMLEQRYFKLSVHCRLFANNPVVASHFVLNSGTHRAIDRR